MVYLYVVHVADERVYKRLKGATPCVSVVAHNTEEVEIVYNYLVNQGIMKPFAGGMYITDKPEPLVGDLAHINTVGYFPAFQLDIALCESEGFVAFNMRAYKLNKLGI